MQASVDTPAQKLLACLRSHSLRSVQELCSSLRELDPEVPNQYRGLSPDNPCARPVQTALLDCEEVEGWGHRTGASCGEPWATQAFCSIQSTPSLKDAKIVAINPTS
jgi:hypothetical protein